MTVLILIFVIDYVHFFRILATAQKKIGLLHKLRKLVIFENFHEEYEAIFGNDIEPVRIPNWAVSKFSAELSCKLESFAGSFLIDAGHFFDVREPQWRWPKLTSLALTSQDLTPNEDPRVISDLLMDAAGAARKMPMLRTMEIWNGREGLAALFRYQTTGDGQPATITWRSTWEFKLASSVFQAWERTAELHRSDRLTVIWEDADGETIIDSHCDAIHYLELSTPVMRPVSLEQISMENWVSRQALLEEEEDEEEKEEEDDEEDEGQEL